MGTPWDIALGRLAVAQGLVPQETVRVLYQALPPGRSLKDELVARGLLAPDRAQALEAALRQHPHAQRASGALQARPPDDGVTMRATSPAPVADDSATMRATSPAPVADDSATRRAGSAPSVGATSLGAARLPEVGEVVAERYELLGLLGEGGMGAVFKARDRETGALYALKVLLPGADDGGALARFRREAGALAKVDAHAGIVRVRGLGEHRGTTYALMDLVVGRDLHDLVKDAGPLELSRALRYTETVARAVQHCHSKNVLHRDLKPANVLLRAEDDAPLVMDFGLALDEDAQRLTKTGDVMGTPAYMSPEQAEGDKQGIDARTDVYALGALLYELATGQAPFRGTQMEILKKVFMDLPAPVRSTRPDAPPDLDVVLRKAMAKDKALRYATAEDFADEVARLARGEPITARAPTSREERLWRAKRGDVGAQMQLRRRRFAAIAAVTAAGLGGVAVWAYLRSVPVLLGKALDAVPAALAAESPLDPDGPATKGAVKALIGLSPDAPTDHARLLALRDLPARSVDGFEDHAAVVADPDRAPEVMAVGRLARRLAVDDGTWPLVAPIVGDEPEERFMRGLQALRWADSATFASLAQDTLCAEHALHHVTDRSSPCALPGAPEARGSLAGLVAAPGAVGAAAKDVLARLELVERAVTDELAARHVAFARLARESMNGTLEERLRAPWADLVPGTTKRVATALDAKGAKQLAGSVHATLRQEKPGALARAIDVLTELVTDASGASRWKQRQAYDRLSDVLTRVVKPFAQDAPRVPYGGADWSPVHEAAVKLVLAVGVRAGESKSGDCEVAFQRLLIDSMGLITTFEVPGMRTNVINPMTQSMQRELAGGTEPRVETVALLPFLGYRAAAREGFLVVARTMMERGDVEAFARKHRMADAYLIVADYLDAASDKFDRKLRDGVRIRPSRDDVDLMQRIRLLYAAAVGEHLDPGTRRRLGLPEAEPLDARLGKAWIGYARAFVAEYTIRLEVKRGDPATSRATIEAALAVFEEQRRRDDLFGSPFLHQKALHLEADSLEELYDKHSADDPAWRQALLAKVEVALRYELEKGFDLAGIIARQERKEGVAEGSIEGADARLDPDHLREFVEDPAIELAGVVENSGRRERSCELLAEALAAYRALGSELPFPFELQLQLGHVLATLGRADETLATVRPVLDEAVQRPGAGEKVRTKRATYRSLARALLADASLAKGDEAAARALLADARRDADPLQALTAGIRPVWPGVLARLGER